jgi:hypothetical protein
LKSKFAEMPPIFKNVEVSRDDIVTTCGRMPWTTTSCIVSLAQMVVFGRDIFVFQSTVEGFVRWQMADVEFIQRGHPLVREEPVYQNREAEVCPHQQLSCPGL